MLKVSILLLLAGILYLAAPLAAQDSTQTSWDVRWRDPAQDRWDWDKQLHFLACGSGSYLLSLMYHFDNEGKYPASEKKMLILSSSMVLGFSLVYEVGASFRYHETDGEGFSKKEVLANVAGALLGSALAYFAFRNYDFESGRPKK